MVGRVRSGGQQKLRFSLFPNPLTLPHVDKVKLPSPPDIVFHWLSALKNQDAFIY